MQPSIIVVEALVPTDSDDTDLRREAWSFALDQRAFGPRRLLVAFSDRFGRFRGLAHTPRTDPPELALASCLQRLGHGADAAVAFCDEPLRWGPPPGDLVERFARARAVCVDFGVYLVDWFSCDDLLIRSSRLALDPGAEWWDVS